MRIAIIGAGIAGLTAARRLVEAGMRCTVFEKSRGLGGRMATRRVGALEFDHGAQYVTARGPRFQARLAQWESEGCMAQWAPGKWVGVPGMTAPARSQGTGLQVHRDCRVTALAGSPGEWRLHRDPVTCGGNPDETWHAVILAIPTPQIPPLIASAGIHFPTLERVHYAPCLTLMLAYDEPGCLRESFLRPTEGPIAWLARNDSKPGRPPASPLWVVHATPEWSQARIDADPEQTAQALFLEARTLLGNAAPVYRGFHRWRYAQVERTADTPFLWDPARRIGACGDWALGPRVECAFDSGEALAEAILETLA